MINTKVCSKCSRALTLSEFSLVYPKKQDGKLRPDCKDCVRQRTWAYIQKNLPAQKARMEIVRKRANEQARVYVDEYLKTHPCVDCGEKDPDVLDFDHVRGEKVCDLSRMKNAGYKLWRIEQEIQKCEVRCANCHRRITRKRERAILV